MIGFIIWIIGLILAIKAVLEIINPMEGRWRQETIGRYSCIAHQLDRTDLLLFLGKRQFTFNVEINRSICIKKENAVLKLRHFLFLLSYVRLPPFHRTDRSSVV